MRAMVDFTDPLGMERPARPIPGWVLAMTASLAGIALVLALVSSRTGVGRVPVTTGPDPAVAELSISFVERSGGEIDVVRQPDGAILARMEAGEGGFMRGILRPLYRERVRHGRDVAAPYRLLRYESGALMLTDASTDLVVDIAAFGATSADRFRSLFTVNAVDP